MGEAAQNVTNPMITPEGTQSIQKDFWPLLNTVQTNRTMPPQEVMNMNVVMNQMVNQLSQVMMKLGLTPQYKKKWIPRCKYRKAQNRKKQPISVVFNISSLILTKAMNKLLNRGLNIVVLPNKLDINQVLVDWKWFERTMIWKEWWFGREGDINMKEPIFKVKKNNMQKNYSMPHGLKTHTNAVRSEIVDPKNRIKVISNLTVEEQDALKELTKLQKNKTIVIKQCDKGAVIIIMNHNDYVKAAEKHLEESIKDCAGNVRPLYKKS